MEEEGGGEIGPQDLDRDLATLLQVLGEMDGGHAALAQRTLDAIAVGEGGRQPLKGSDTGGAPAELPTKLRAVWGSA
jgi:hypothetical protein